jgi:hypothetical protein
MRNKEKAFVTDKTPDLEKLDAVERGRLKDWGRERPKTGASCAT